MCVTWTLYCCDWFLWTVHRDATTLVTTITTTAAAAENIITVTVVTYGMFDAVWFIHEEYFQ